MSSMKTTPQYRETLGALSSQLAKIHKMLLDSEIGDIELRQGRVLNPLEKLNILLNAPELAWLRPMSQLMAFIDEIYFQKEGITGEQMTAAKKGVDELLIHHTNEVFSAKYRELLGSLPDLIFEHGHLKAALKEFAVQ